MVSGVNQALRWQAVYFRRPMADADLSGRRVIRWVPTMELVTVTQVQPTRRNP
jgi:hypothetical protein